MARRRSRARSVAREPRPESIGAPPPTPAWRSALPAYLVSRVVVFATAYVAQRVWPERIRVPWRAFPDVLLLDGMLRWDSGWYWNIIEHGYQYVPGKQSNVAFFPLFPLLSWLGGLPLELLGMSPRRAFFAAGLFLSNTAFFVALVGLHRLAQRTLGDVPAARAVWLLALYPFSFFFSAAYTEALALALAVWAFYLASRNRWVLAALLAALCTATRTPGIFLAPALALELLRQRGF